MPAEITYQVEPWTPTWQELAPYWKAHWEEVALHQDTLPLEVDLDAYARLEAQGILHLVTVREAGQIIGYHLSMIRQHLRYRVLACVTDVYYLAPTHRKGMVGYRLFQEVERTAAAKGVRYFFTGTKLSLNMGRLFERLGWVHTEQLYIKLLPPPPMPSAEEA